MVWWTWRDRPAELTEILDRRDVADELRYQVLAQLPRVNRWLGGWWALRRELERVAGAGALGERLLDVGCGVGDLGARARRWAERRGGLWVVGVDLSRRSLRQAASWSVVPVCASGFALPFADRSFDVVTASMLLHHFSGAALERLFAELCRVAARAVIINDLLRHRLAWVGWQLWSFFFAKDNIIRYDGAVSVRKGFVAEELYALGATVGGFRWEVRRHPGFRICLTGLRTTEAGV